MSVGVGRGVGGHHCYRSGFCSFYTKVLVTLVHGTGMEDLAKVWLKELKRESNEVEKVLAVVELENLSKTEVETLIEQAGVVVVSTPHNSLGCVLHSQLAR